MKERLLQFIWQHQLFTKPVFNTDGKIVHIVHPGSHNPNQGPDFLNAHIKIDDIDWHGSIELHVHAKDWITHQHQVSQHYNNVILHIVWNNDCIINPRIPTIEISNYVPKILLEKYDQLMNNHQPIACHNQITKVDATHIEVWKESLLIERWIQKTADIEQLLHSTKQNWEQIFWQKLAYGFGLKVNASLFEAMAASIPITVLAKQKHVLLQIEAMLFGQANLLSTNPRDEYEFQLQVEHHFIKTKYHLPSVYQEPQWLRMRPINFPTVRLAQLAMLMHQSIHLFSTLQEVKTIKEVIKLFLVSPSRYWLTHYQFGKASPPISKRVGLQQIHHLLINAVFPVMYTYAKYNQLYELQNRCLQWMYELPSEVNYKTNYFSALGIPLKNAADTQAITQLYNAYCSVKRCLNCTIGYQLLRTSSN